MTFDLKAFQKTLRYQASPTAVQLRSQLKHIAGQDTIAEKKVKAYTPIAIVCGVLTFFSFIFVILLPAIGVLLFIGLLTGTVVTSVIASRWTRLDIANIRYLLPPRVADILSRDMAANAPFDVDLDFSKPTSQQKIIGTHPWPGRQGWKEAVFEDPWFAMSGQFLDKTFFSLSLTELTVVRSGWKRGRSGKTKHKRKTKPKGLEAKLFLKFSRKKYGAIAMLNDELSQAVSLPPEVVLKQIKANDHQLVFRVKVPAHSAILKDPNSPEALSGLVTQMLLSAYQALNLSKTLSKAS